MNTFQIEFNKDTFSSVARIFVGTTRTSAFVPVYDGKWQYDPGLTKAQKEQAIRIYQHHFDQPF